MVKKGDFERDEKKSIKKMKKETLEKVEEIKAKRKYENKPGRIINTNILDFKEKVEVPEYLKYLFG